MKNIFMALFWMLLLFPSYLFGQNQDTSCVCGNRAPHINENIIVEEIASYPGGIKTLEKYLKTNIELESTENGEIVISFIISCSGKTCGFDFIEKKGKFSAEIENKTIEALKKMDTWKPAKQRNKPIDIPFIISLNITNGILKIKSIHK